MQATSKAGLDELRSVWLTPDGKQVAASLGDYAGPTKRWDLATGQPLQDIPARSQDFARSPDGSIIAGSPRDGAVQPKGDTSGIRITPGHVSRALRKFTGIDSNTTIAPQFMLDATEDLLLFT